MVNAPLTGLGRTVVVPIANPASARPLLGHAARLAAADSGNVELVTVVGPTAGSDDRARAWQGLADAEATATDLGVTARVRVVVADDPALGVLAAIADVDASLVLMGWRRGSSSTDVFGRLIDSVIGRSRVPLAIVRLGSVPHRRVLLPVSADHLLPGGEGGLGLAAELARRLRGPSDEPTTLVRTGPREMELPRWLVQLGDRVHHDPRRTDQAVGAIARADDLVVAAVAPTVSGLRAATTHLAWAAPEATLLVAVDVGPTRESGLERAVSDAGQPAPPTGATTTRDVRIVVTARLPDDRQVTPEHLDRVLREAGASHDLMAWWPSGDPRPHVRATVTVRADGINAAIGAVMVAVHEAPLLRGAEITYDVDRDDRSGSSLAVRKDDVSVVEDGTEDRDASTRRR